MRIRRIQIAIKTDVTHCYPLSVKIDIVHHLPGQTIMINKSSYLRKKGISPNPFDPNNQQDRQYSEWRWHL